LGAAAEDLVLDFGGLGLWLLKNDTLAEWHQIISQETAFACKARLAGSANDQLIFVYASAPGLYVWSYSSFPGTITTIDTATPDSDGAVEPFDPDGAYDPTDTEEELAIDMGSNGLWLYDSSTAGWALLNADNPLFMVRGDFWTDSAKTTLIVNFGAQGLWLYDGSFDNWWQLSSFAPDGNYGF